MPASCRWCSRPAVRTIVVDAPPGAPNRVALCERHLHAINRARAADPEAQRRRRHRAEAEAWERVFREPAPFADPAA